MFCPNCGKELPDFAMFCSECGHSFEKPSEYRNDEAFPAANQTASENSNRTHSEKKPPIWLFVVIAACVAGGLIFRFVSTRGAQEAVGIQPPENTVQDIAEEDDIPDSPEEGSTTQSGTDKEDVPATEAEQTEYYETAESPSVEESDTFTESSSAEPVLTADNAVALGYSIPDSSTRFLSREELAGLNTNQLRYIRNEIYARHGYIFVSDDLREFFESTSWYHGTIASNRFSDEMLNEIERANVQLLTTVEQEMQNTNVQTMYCCASEYATLRSVASRSGEDLAHIPSRAAVQVIGAPVGDFYNVSYNGQRGYVLSEFFSSDPNAPLNYGSGSAAGTQSAGTLVLYCCASDFATLRSIASRSGNSLAQIPSRAAVQVIGNTVGEFYYVSYNGMSGYVLIDYFSADPNAPLNYGTR